MPAGIGYSFSPNQSQDIPMQGRPGGGQLSPDIVKLLSLRIPNRNVPGQIASPQLTGSQPGGGGGFDMNTLLQALMRSFAPQALGLPERGPGFQSSQAAPGFQPSPGGGRSIQPVPFPRPNVPRPHIGVGASQGGPPGSGLEGQGEPPWGGGSLEDFTLPFRAPQPPIPNFDQDLLPLF